MQLVGDLAQLLLHGRVVVLSSTVMLHSGHLWSLLICRV